MLTLSPARRAAIIAELEHWEDRANYLHLGSAEPATVTVGIGCVLRSPTEACDLPLRVAPSGRPATEVEKLADFVRVRAMPGGRPARTYQAREPALVIYLDDDDVMTLAMRRLDGALMDLEALLPGFADYPEPAQDCLIDLAWRLSFGELTRFHSLILACRQRAWATAAHGFQGTSPRTIWRAQQFVRCVAATG